MGLKIDQVTVKLAATPRAKVRAASGAVAASSTEATGAEGAGRQTERDLLFVS